MIDERSCGSVVYKVENGVYHFLLIKQKNGNHYGFPKGHTENEETPIQTAKREVYEETGIEINLFSNLYQTIYYEPKEGVKKQVDYFLSEAINTEPIKQEVEIDEVLWVKKDEVIEMLTYENDKEVFKKLTSHLKKIKKRGIINFSLLLVIVLSFVTLTDFFNWGYWYKSSFKLILFIFIPYLYLSMNKLSNLNLLKIKKKEVYQFGMYALFIYIITLLGYFIVRNWVDFSNIPETLEKTLGITRENFIYVALYIPIINALIEEFFFRGFIINYFRKYLKASLTVLLSATLFALYHIAIILTWAPPLIIILAILGLFLVGIVFGIIAYKKKSITHTYMLHFAANLAINTAGLIILGML